MNLNLAGSALAGGVLMSVVASASADESLFSKVQGVETLPEGSWEFYQVIRDRSDKGVGDYQALDSTTEVEYGLSNQFSVSAAVKAMALDTSGIVVDAYLPGANDFGFKFSGIEASAKYNFLRPALNDIGLSAYWAVDYLTIDPHSGFDKDTLSFESSLLLQDYLLEGQFVWVANLGLEATYADRAPIANLPAGFEWPTDPEMELELTGGAGFSYRFAPGWFVGAEALYETEFETEVGQERWSVFAGPNLHYGSQGWWVTLSWLSQLRGGGELVTPGDDLHLIEKTKSEVSLKFGLNF